MAYVEQQICITCKQVTTHMNGNCEICAAKQTKFNPDDANKSKTGSLRFNTGKPEVSQLDPKFVIDLADLMTESAKKYGKYNWMLGQNYSTPYDSLQRHMMSFMDGEDLDVESKKSHLLHAAANIMIMYNTYLKQDEDFDDRPRKVLDKLKKG